MDEHVKNVSKKTDGNGNYINMQDAYAVEANDMGARNQIGYTSSSSNSK